MTRHTHRWALLFFAFTASALLLGSCGYEEPVFQPGNIVVNSSPAGASILIGGQDSELDTPATLTGLEPGNYVVSVTIDGYESLPAFQTAIVSPLVTTVLDTFLLSTTTLLVTSNPPGASIFLDGQDTGQVTPFTFVGIELGAVDISLVLEGYLVSPAAITADVIDGSNVVPEETFLFRSRHTVLFEGFSSVNCNGCPDLATNMGDLMHREGLGLDRVLYVKFSMNWPGFDPHNEYNTEENDARGMVYLAEVGWGIPALFMAGVNLTGTSASSTPFADEILPFLEDNLAVDPGFLIDVTADFSATDVPVEITLTAREDVALADKVLFVALVQTLIEYDEAPGSQGETEFHYVFRDQADNVDPLIDLSGGQVHTINTNLLRDDWDTSTLMVIAFVQDEGDHTIFQAGSTAATLAAPAHKFLNPNRHHRLTIPGVDRP